jgi:hypothetical protein
MRQPRPEIAECPVQEENGAADSGVGLLKDVTSNGDLCAGKGIGVL